ncbi:hypothetical protein OUZ56_024905 [Daphnia magna]|uniref:Uncharacterized protein n=1 Tax=Daphnia magna TaxID=35525 RepID=A0ABQ9ZID3_9CRUS|nr:hypothetical protein OUZ56_024905 [Daphnia magna]
MSAILGMSQFTLDLVNITRNEHFQPIHVDEVEQPGFRLDLIRWRNGSNLKLAKLIWSGRAGQISLRWTSCVVELY